MIPDFEILLVLGGLAFYVFDSATLLHADELLLEKAGRRLFVRKGFGMIVNGKRPFIPNPATPHRPLMLVSVGSFLEDQQPRNHLQHFLDALLPFKTLSVFLLLLFFPVLPILLYFYGNGFELLIWLGLVYSCVAAVIYHLIRRRRVLELSPRAIAAIGFECLACAPFAINIVRKLTLRKNTTPLNKNRLEATSGDFQALLIEACRSIDEMLMEYDPDSLEPRAVKLNEQKVELRRLHDDY